MSETVKATRVIREDNSESIQIGQYYEYAKPLDRKEEIRLFEGQLSLGELVVVTDVGEQIEVFSGENGWDLSFDLFLEHFRFEPNGLMIRQGHIAKLQQENFSEQVQFQQLQNALLTFSPHVDQPGEVVEESNLPTEESTALATRETGAALAQRKLTNFTGVIKKTEASIASRTARIAAIMAEQSRAMQGKAKQMEEALKLAQEGLWTINLYMGMNEKVVQLKSGKPAAAEEKIIISQLVLYMDEECAFAAEKGGIDFKSIPEFDNWLKSPKHLQQVLPYTKGIVALKARRTHKHYSSDPWTNARINKENDHTYWLIRNGDNLYRVDTDFEVGDHIVPLENEYLEMFQTDEFNYDSHQREKKPVRPGDPKYMEIMKNADAKKRHYMRILLILQGLIDRAVRTEDGELRRLFHPMPDGMERINIMNERLHEQYVRYIYDAESRKLFGHGRPTFVEWISDLNARLQIGHRVIINTTAMAYGGEERKNRVSPSGARWPDDLSIHTIEKRTGEDMFFYYERDGEETYRGWGRGFQAVQKRASFRVSPDDEHVLNFDLATVEDMEFYLANRLERHGYMKMFPVIKLAIQLKQKEKADEAPFRLLLIGQIKQAFESVSIEYIEGQIDDLIYWWKFKNRTHRALQSADKLAIKMIIEEFGLRRQKDAERSRMDHSPVVAEILKRHSNAIYIGHKVDNQYVALIPENDENVFVNEQTYTVGVRKGVKLEEEKHWRTIDGRRLRWLQVYASERYSGWDFDARAEQFLTDPERQRIVDAIILSVNGPAGEDNLFDKEEAAAKEAHLIAITLTDKQEVIGWIVQGKVRVPSLLMTGEWRKPHDVRVLVGTWERKRDGFTFKLSRGALYTVGREGQWTQKTDRYGNFHNLKVLWTDEAVQRKWDADWERYEKGERERDRLSQIVRKAVDTTAIVIKENVVAMERQRYIKEFGDEGESLFEIEKGKIQWSYMTPRAYNLDNALDRLVERGINPNGWTVGRIYSEAEKYGFKLDKSPRNSGQKGEPTPRDLDVLPPDFVVEVQMNRQLEEAQSEEDDE